MSKKTCKPSKSGKSLCPPVDIPKSKTELKGYVKVSDVSKEEIAKFNAEQKR